VLRRIRAKLGADSQLTRSTVSTSTRLIHLRNKQRISRHSNSGLSFPFTRGVLIFPEACDISHTCRSLSLVPIRRRVIIPKMFRPSADVALASADRKIQPGRTALLGGSFHCQGSPSYRYAPGFARIGTNEVKAFRKRHSPAHGGVYARPLHREATGIAPRSIKDKNAMASCRHEFSVKRHTTEKLARD